MSQTGIFCTLASQIAQEANFFKHSENMLDYIANGIMKKYIYNICNIIYIYI